MNKNVSRGETNMQSIAQRLNTLTMDQNISLSKQEVEVKKNNAALILPPEINANLFVNGKLNKAHAGYSSKNIHVHEGLYREIKQHCRGLDQAIFNYLLHLGLESVKNLDKLLMADVQEVEKRYRC